MANSDDKYNSNNALVQKSRPLFSLWKEKEKINLFEYKMLDKYLSKINSHDPDNRIVTFSLEDINEILPSHISKAELHQKLKKMQGLVVSYGDDEGVTLFEYSKIHIDKDTFDVQLMCTQTAHKYFFNIERIGYFKYKFRNILALNSMYSYILFNFLEMNRFRKQPFEIELAEMKKILGCDNHTYDEFRYFNRQILKKCFEEINEKTELQYTYEPVRVNRTVQRISFNVIPSKQIEEIMRDYDEIDVVEADAQPENIELSLETQKGSAESSNFESEPIADEEAETTDSEEMMDERTSFFSDCFDNTFNTLQVQVLVSTVKDECMQHTSFGNDIDKFNYLHLWYKRFCLEEKERKIQNRFKYFLAMIENDVPKESSENKQDGTDMSKYDFLVNKF